MRGAWLVFKKEAMELAKDRRTLLFTFGMPLILYPVIFSMMTKLGQNDEAKRKGQPSRVCVTDASGALLPVLKADGKDFQVVERPDGDLGKALRDQKLEMALEVAPDAAQSLAQQKTFTITATVDKSDDSSELALKRLKDFLKEQDRTWVSARLQAISAPAQLAAPSQVEEKNVMDLTLTLGKILGSFLPYVLLITMYAGAMQHGAYMTAGERERGTLLSLLSTRIPRTQIITGKLLAIFGVGILAVVTNLTGMAMGFGRMSGQIQAHAIAEQGAQLNASSLLSMAGPSTLGLTFLLLVPLGLFFSAIILMVGTQARTTREAATALAPGIFIVVVLGVFSSAPGIEKMAFLPWIPVLNVSLAIRKLFSQQFDQVQYLIALVMTIGLAGLLTLAAGKVLDRESALFKA